MNSIPHVADPAEYIEQSWRDFVANDVGSACYIFSYDFIQYYLDDAPTIKLIALLALRRSSGNEVDAAVSISAEEKLFTDNLIPVDVTWDDARNWVQERSLSWLPLRQPMRLLPINIPKPWGQEIWYTGIEERGQSLVGDDGNAIPLPWLLSLDSNTYPIIASPNIVLLKILDPLPQEVTGDLYFELHEEKREVYIVTHVHEEAWPNGVGGIRMGFSPQKRKEFKSFADFKSAYLSAVRDYREVRQRIDAQLDQWREDENIPLNDPLNSQVLESWLQNIPQDWRDEEEHLRQKMDEYCHVKELRVGDVVKVPLRVPHSLLRGVRTIEFQTPVYERRILSFAQKVLTQSHWDTEDALALVDSDMPSENELDIVHHSNEVRIERVVDFEDFFVERYTLQAGSEFVKSDIQSYAVIIGVAGSISINALTIEAEQACLLPVAATTLCSRNLSSSEHAIFLVALPQL